MEEMRKVLRRKGFRRVKKRTSSKELKKLKGGRKEKGLGVEVCLPSCWPLVLLSTYCVQGTVGGFLEEIRMGQPQPSHSEGDLLVNP